MKPLSFKIPKTERQSFLLQLDDMPHFYDRLHFHPEWQITLITKSEGTLFVGNSVNRFKEGDILVIGSNVPHLLKNDETYYQNGSLGAQSWSIFFGEDTFGVAFFETPELKRIKKFLRAAAKGIRINDTSKKAKISALILGLDGLSGPKRLIQFLQILDLLSACKDLEELSKGSLVEIQNEADGQKMNAVFQLMLQHYQRSISLEEAAATSNLSIPAFCRYFKLHTRKTFIQMLNELRISNACKLISAANQSMSEIAYEVGFNNLSNFNRQFKQIMNCTPSEYQAQFK